MIVSFIFFSPYRKFFYLNVVLDRVWVTCGVAPSHHKSIYIKQRGSPEAERVGTEDSTKLNYLLAAPVIDIGLSPIVTKTLTPDSQE